jgi:hypothetical protein
MTRGALVDVPSQDKRAVLYRMVMPGIFSVWSQGKGPVGARGLDGRRPSPDIAGRDQCPSKRIMRSKRRLKCLSATKGSAVTVRCRHTLASQSVIPTPSRTSRSSPCLALRLLALAASWSALRTPLKVRTAERFIAFSMCVLAILKLRDLEGFSNMYLGNGLF